MNTHPNTPFGKFFFKLGIWQPSIEDAIAKLYKKLEDTEKDAIQHASGWIAIINAHLQDAPDVIFSIIQEKFPNVTKESITGALNKLNTAILKVGTDTPDNFESALSKLQGYLSKYQGNEWIAITRAVVSVLTTILSTVGSPIQTVELVLEYVYRNFIKGKVVPES